MLREVNCIVTISQIKLAISKRYVKPVALKGVLQVTTSIETD
jgi:hypothetical protein